MTSRRAFLASLGAAAFVAPDAERLLWRPGAKTISIAAPRVFESGAAIMAAMRDNWISTVGCTCERCLPLEMTKREYNASHAAWIERVRRGERVRVIG